MTEIIFFFTQKSFYFFDEIFLKTEDSIVVETTHDNEIDSESPPRREVLGGAHEYVGTWNAI